MSDPREDGVRHDALRLHIEHLRIEGTGPMVAERLAEEVRRQLEALITAYGMPPPRAGGNALRLDDLRVELEPGVGREQVAGAIARRLFRELYGPLPSWTSREVLAEGAAAPEGEG